METFPYKISLDKSETLSPYKQKFIVYFRYKTGHGVSNDIDNCCVILHVMRAAKGFRTMYKFYIESYNTLFFLRPSGALHSIL